MYAPGARLLGTLDTERVRVDEASVQRYFTFFLRQSADTIAPSFPEPSHDGLQLLAPDVAAYSGYYQFKMSKAGVRRVANAKFTFVFQREESGQLRILLQTSGLTPLGVLFEKGS